MFENVRLNEKMIKKEPKREAYLAERGPEQ
jgi:hypothetical protein